MPLVRLDPPGRVPDLDDQGLADWSEVVSDTLDAARLGQTAKRSQFFNALKDPIADDSVEKSIEWVAFPRIVEDGPGSQRQKWERADGSRSLQDEYCEWSVARDGDGKISRVTFTSEPGFYWEFLARRDRKKVLALYRDHVDPAVAEEDLFPGGGDYDPQNQWNSSTTDGAMHLIQPSNTLGAEIELAAAATVVRRKGQRVITAEQELIECSLFGEPGRNSDPHIGGEVNEVARLGGDVTIADPIGLYIDRLVTAGWETLDGTDPQNYWSTTRGVKGHAVRAVYEVPPGTGYVVGDILIDGQPIEFGSQIAERLFIRISGVGCRFDAAKVVPRPCVEAGGPAIVGVAPTPTAPDDGTERLRLERR